MTYTPPDKFDPILEAYLEKEARNVEDFERDLHEPIVALRAELSAAESKVDALTQRAEVAEGREIKLEAGKSLAEHERNEARQQVDALMRENREHRQRIIDQAFEHLDKMKATPCVKKECCEMRKRINEYWGPENSRLKDEVDNLMREKEELRRTIAVCEKLAINIMLTKSRDLDDWFDDVSYLKASLGSALVREQQNTTQEDLSDARSTNHPSITGG